MEFFMADDVWCQSNARWYCWYVLDGNIMENALTLLSWYYEWVGLFQIRQVAETLHFWIYCFYLGCRHHGMLLLITSIYVQILMVFRSVLLGSSQLVHVRKYMARYTGIVSMQTNLPEVVKSDCDVI